MGAEGPAPPTPHGPTLLSSLPPQVAARAVLGHLGFIRWVWGGGLGCDHGCRWVGVVGVLQGTGGILGDS